MDNIKEIAKLAANFKYDSEDYIKIQNLPESYKNFIYELRDFRGYICNITNDKYEKEISETFIQLSNYILKSINR